MSPARPSVVLSLLLALAGVARAGGFAVTLDGSPVPVECVSPSGSPDAPRAGDLVLVAGVWICLDGPEPLELRMLRRPWGRLLVAAEDGRVVAADVDSSPPGDPLSAWDAARVRALRGISLSLPVEDLAGILARIDPARCAVRLGKFLGDSPSDALHVLPPDLGNLALACGSDTRFSDLPVLARLNRLRVLHADDRVALPGDVLGRLTSLRALHTPLPDADTGQLVKLRRLRFLEVARGRSPRDLDFVRDLPELRVLDVAGTSVMDLSPLADHPRLAILDVSRTPVESLRALSGHPALRRVTARWSRVSRLPAGDAGVLERLDVLGARVPDAEAASFRARRPSCHLFHRRLDPLRDAILRANRLRLREEGTCCGVASARARTLFTTRDPAEIRGLLDAIEVAELDPDEEIPPCECCGTMTLELWRDDRLLAAISVHHGAALRWRGWSGDADLTARGRESFRAWVDARVEGEVNWD